jgi:hypothetical protein
MGSKRYGASVSKRPRAPSLAQRKWDDWGDGRQARYPSCHQHHRIYGIRKHRIPSYVTHVFREILSRGESGFWTSLHKSHISDSESRAHVAFRTVHSSLSATRPEEYSSCFCEWRSLEKISLALLC